MPKRALRAGPVLAGLLLCLLCAGEASANPSLPREYSDRFAAFDKRQQLFEQLLRQVGLTSGDVGRSFALVIGVSRYPELQDASKDLPPAAVDVAQLVAYLKEYEKFEEIVVLQNGHFSEETLRYFLRDYFPGRMRQFPKSRFLFAFSGHGTSETGHLLFPAARHLKDAARGLALDQLHLYLQESVKAAHHSLVLINSCYSGAFRQQPYGGGMIPQQPGAHAITAGGSREKAWGSHAGGSIFFEKLIQGLGGDADTLPVRGGVHGDGIVTVEELFAYLKTEVQISTDQRQNPQLGSLRRDSPGSFFFFNRNRPVRQGWLAEWIPGKWIPFGAAAHDAYVKGLEAARQGRLPAAIASLQEAADASHPRAMITLAALYSEGIGVPKNDRQAFRLAESAARLQDAYAMAMLGYMHSQGLGTKQDLLQAAISYRQAADGGNSIGAMNLAEMHAVGYGVSKDEKEAFRWMKRAVELQDYRAMGRLGVMYYQGRGVEKNISQAGQWLRKAAAADGADEEAMTTLGFFLAEGPQTAATDTEAVRWFEKASDMGYPQAMRALAFMYSAGRGVGRTDEARAHDLYLRAAQKGDAYAMYNLGVRYLNGRGASLNPAEALTWFGQAAKEGFPPSMTALGRMYVEGRPGVPKNPTLAKEWFEKAAAADDAEAMHSLGLMYLRGMGIERNRAKAAIWFDKAASLGLDEAREELRRLK